MCWNAPVSLASFLSSIFICAYLWYRNYPIDRPIALWIACFSLMQLFEFFMWRDMKNHTLVSKLSHVSILLQPFSLATGLYYYNSLKNRAWENYLLLAILSMSLFKATAAGLFALTDTKYKWLSKVGPNCHLIWWFSANDHLIPPVARVDFMYLFSLFLATLLIKPFKYALIYNCIGVITYVITRIFYTTSEYGSLWCWVSNILAFVTLGLPYIKF
jgi:hypothetical protein